MHGVEGLYCISINKINLQYHPKVEWKYIHVLNIQLIKYLLSKFPVIRMFFL